MGTLAELAPQDGSLRVRRTEIVVSGGPDHGHPSLTLRSGLLAPRLLATAPGVAHVALVATTATLLAGDQMEMRIQVGDGARLELQEVAATVAYHGRGGRVRWDVAVSVGPDSTLVWHGQPLVVADGADVEQALNLDVARGGRVLMRDAVVLGRHGQRGGSLRRDTRVSYDASPLLLEQTDFTDRAGGVDRTAPGVIGDHRVVDTVTWVGDPVPETGSTVGIQECGDLVLLELPGPGLMARHLGERTHRSPLIPVWEHASLGVLGREV